MICDTCLARIAQRQTFFSSTRAIRRTFVSSAFRQATPITTDTATQTVGRPNGKPAATSTSAAQPFTAGSTTATATTTTKTSVKDAGPQRPPSAAPAGTVLKGINFMKNKQDPVALEDHEYPDWLWSALDKKKGDGDDLGSEGDMFSKSKKQRRAAAKALRKKQLANPDGFLPKVPLYEQTIDIYAGDGTLEGAKQAGAERKELTKAMRDQRRSKIKETNFLKAMG